MHASYPSLTVYTLTTYNTQVDAKISELPGGTLFPDDLAKRLIKMYDQNGDGVLQQSEFAPTEELRARLESIFRERREEELEVRKAERKREMDMKLKSQGDKGQSSGGGDREASSATGVEKALCALPYILPLSDGIMYAQHIYTKFPQQMAWSEPLAVSFLLLWLHVMRFGASNLVWYMTAWWTRDVYACPRFFVVFLPFLRVCTSGL